MNVLKWLGHPITYEFLPEARRVCNWGPDFSGDGGCEREDVEDALKYFGVKQKGKISPTLEEVDAHLDNGGIILLDYYMPVYKSEKGGHFAVCIGRTDKSYTVVNVMHYA
jgi:hypothetical protein